MILKGHATLEGFGLISVGKGNFVAHFMILEPFQKLRMLILAQEYSMEFQVSMTSSKACWLYFK
jgi:hypothetical protein